MSIVQLIAKIEEYKGRQQLYTQQSPQVLEALRHVAMIQSTESSNRLEGITVPAKKLEELVADKVTPANRSEGEVAGYRDVLATIHASFPHIPVTSSTILQFHRDLYKFVASEGGHWKQSDNVIEEVHPNGTRIVRFAPVSAALTPFTMQELSESLTRLTQEENTASLLLLSTFILDFLCIHPFRDGNGRMSRLLTLLLLYQHGYEVGRYISLERIIEESKQSYYDSLGLSSRDWHEGRHTLYPWWEYFLGVMLAAYREFENRVGIISSGRGAKSALVRQMAERFVGDFSMAELLKLCPAVSRPMIRAVLEQMRLEGSVACLGKGRFARWHRM
jgi:Fic family protein